ncbi:MULTISPECIES: class I SAM-dependent methyltransferase [Niallia]|uniref:class I SAM-dependent methyltransferase n=1 Tax=Niallia TaxID=2837506 RepID=UPI0011ADB027|nr:methyltransferase domain-containing protein [Niallia circulans]
MTDINFHRYLEEINEKFSGWDFSSIYDTGRIQNSMISWSYGSKVISAMQETTAVLDMGTGGGEFLSLLKGYFPSIIYATEGYKPNVSIAKKKLEPLGVRVMEVVDDNELPFPDNHFDLIINRHESYSVKEVKRILKPKGIFLTQQVGGLDCKEINDWFGVPLNPEFKEWKLSAALNQFSLTEWEVLEYQEEFPIQRFYDLGALIYYLKAIPWQVPDFGVEKYQNELYRLYQHIEKTGFFDASQSRFYLKVRKQ